MFRTAFGDQPFTSLRQAATKGATRAEIPPNADPMRTHQPLAPADELAGAVKPQAERGRSGIRTHEPLAGLTIFKTVAFVRSATLPSRL